MCKAISVKFHFSLTADKRNILCIDHLIFIAKIGKFLDRASVLAIKI